MPERCIQVDVALAKSGKPEVSLTSTDILEGVDIPLLFDRHGEAELLHEARDTMSIGDNGAAGIALAIDVVGLGASAQDPTPKADLPRYDPHAMVVGDRSGRRPGIPSP